MIEGRFEVASLIAKRGATEVHRAREVSTGRWVALRLLHTSRPGHLADRFAHDCELIARLRHPAIAEIVAYGKDPSVGLWIATEWIDGETLEARLGSGTLSLSECVEIARRVAMPLSAAHAVGVVHRDLRPSNILFAGGRLDSARLLELGVSWVEGTWSLPGGDSSRAPSYMSPELAKGSKLGPPADVFSLGCILFECFTGTPPFGSGPPLAVRTKLLLGEAQRLESLRPDSPAWFVAMIHRMLAKDPRDRFEDAAGVLEAIAAARRPLQRDVTDAQAEASPEPPSVASLSWPPGEAQERREGPRPLRGQPSPFVGREAELDRLLRLCGEAAETRACRVALVTGAPGMGKSRLRHELMVALEAKHPTPTTLLGRGDVQRRTTALSLVGSSFRDLLGPREGESEPAARHRVRARVARNVNRAERDRVAAFVGELVGVSFPDDTHPLLQETRGDRTRAMDQMRTACIDFLGAELAKGPVVWVLDDMHAADAPSIMFVDYALRLFADSPLVVLGFARSEIASQFRSQWGGRAVMSLPLVPITPTASRLIAAKALGSDDARVDSIVDRAQGNPFFLEEILRAALAGEGDALPQTLVDVLQSQLATLEPLARRVSSAASVLGERFTTTGVCAILQSAASAEVERVLRRLVDGELLRALEGAGPNDLGFEFRSEIVRGACYDLLTDEERAVAHRLAAEWLESMASSRSTIAGDAPEIARHFHLAGDRKRAAMWHVRDAEGALEVGDFTQADDASARAVEAGAGGLLLARARLIQAEAARHAGLGEPMFARASEAMQLLPAGSSAWWTATVDALGGAVQLAATDRIDVLTRQIAALPAPPLIDASRAAVHWLHVGRQADANALLEVITEDDPGAEARGARTGWLHRALAYRAMYRGDTGAHLEHSERAVAAFGSVGDSREAAAELVSLGFIRHELGLYVESEESLRESLAMAERLELPPVIADARERLGTVLMRLGLTVEAEGYLRSSLERFIEQGNRRLEGRCRRQLGLLYLDRRALDDAFEEIMHASQLLSAFPPLLPTALAACARLLLATGREDEAMFMATDANDALTRVQTVDEGEAFTRLTYAETLFTVARVSAANDAIRIARDRLLERSRQLPPMYRRAFLEDVSENRRTIELATEWLRRVTVLQDPDGSSPSAPPPLPVGREEAPFANLPRDIPIRPKLTLRAVNPEPGPESSRAPTRPVGIVVSASPDRQNLLASALNALKVDIYRAASAREVAKHLEGLRAAPPKLAIFIDPLTPDLESKRFVEALRAHPKSAGCRVVIASAGTPAKLRSTAREWGADGHLAMSGKAPEIAEAMRSFF